MKINLNRELLYKMYVTDKKSSYDIASELGYSDRYIRYKLEEYNLSRDISTSMKVKNNELKEFYSPLHSQINWQIPTKRREVYMWARCFYNSDVDINRLINSLCVNDFYELNFDECYCSDSDYSSEQEEFLFELNIHLPFSAKEYFVVGDCFITNQKHEIMTRGKRENMRILNSDMIDVRINPLNVDVRKYSMIPDEELKEIVKNEQPKDVFDKIPESIKACIKESKPIYFEDGSVYHLKRDEIPYLVYGKSLPSVYFQYLSYMDKMRSLKFSGVLGQNDIPVYTNGPTIDMCVLEKVEEIDVFRKKLMCGLRFLYPNWKLTFAMSKKDIQQYLEKRK